MNFKFKRLWSGAAAIAVAAATAPLFSVPAAYAAGSLQGTAAIKSAGGAATLNSGNSGTTFTLRLPQVVRSVTGNTTTGSNSITNLSATFTNADLGAVVTGTGMPAATTITAIVSGTQVTISNNATATGTGVALTTTQGASCPGDSASGGYRWQTYMVPSSTNPANLQFGSNGPTPSGTGASFSQPLFDTVGNSVANQQTAAAAAAGAPGNIVNIPDMNMSVFTPGQIPAGVYNIGVACTNGGPSTTQESSYWNTQITVTTDAAAGGPAQVDWAFGAIPPVPTGVTVTPGDTTLTVGFAAGAPATPPVTGFTATATPQPSGTPVTATGTASPITIPGLTNGTTYNVTVHATNSTGNSAESSPAVAGTPAFPACPTVTGLTAVPGTGKVDLSWTAPAAASGCTVSGYSVAYSPSGGTPASPFTVTTTSASVTGLTAGTAYSFTVTPQEPAGRSAPAAGPVSAAPQSAQVIVQDITVTRPAGAIVLTQICGNFGALPADTSASIGFPSGSLPAATAASTPTAPTTTAGGSTPDPVYSGYPYPTNPDGTPNATYPTHCGINLGNAQFVKSGPGAGQFFAASGRLNQLTIVDTRDTDTGWNIVGTVSRFVNASNSAKNFSGSELGWDPVKTSTTPAFTDSDGNTYTQTANAGAQVEPNTPNATGLGNGRTLGTAAALAGTSPNFTGGLGTAVWDARLKLLIPVTAVSGVYNATLTFTVI